MLSVGAIIISSIIIVVCLVGLILSFVLKNKKEKMQIEKSNNAFLNLFNKTKKQKTKTQIKTCENCGAVIEAIDGKVDCPYCGAKYLKK